MADKGELSAKQEAFVVAYIANKFNATQAAISAGYSAKTAESQGSRLLRNVKVSAAIAERMREGLQRQEITADWVLQELGKMARFDARKMFAADGTLLPVTSLDDDTAASIGGIEMSEITQNGRQIGVLKKIKILDRGKNLERLGRHFKLFVDTVEHKGTVGVQLVHSVPRPKRDAQD